MTHGQIKEPRRTAVVGPEQVTKEMSLFDYLAACRPPIDQKLIDIALSQVQVPRNLREDAAQHIRMLWSTLKPDTERFSPGQIASYAHRSARNAALLVRRELGAAVRLPGSAFRRRADGSSYVTPGVLSVPLDWSDLESWFDANDSGAESTETRPSLDPCPVADLDQISKAAPDCDLEEDDDDLRRRRRIDALERSARLLSRPQYIVLSRLIAGESIDAIEHHTGYKKAVIKREVAIGASLMGQEFTAEIAGV